MSETDQSTFVNRHGRRYAADSESHTPPVKSVDRPPAKTPSRKRAVNLTSKLPPYKIRRLATIVGLFVVGLILAIVIIADSSKRGYERQTAAMIRSVADISKRSPSSNEKASETSRSLVTGLAAPADCKPSGIDVSRWYPQAQTAHKECQQIANDYASLKALLKSMSESAAYVESVNNTLRVPIAPPSETQYAIAQNYEQLWTEAHEKLKTQAVPDSVKDSHQVTIQRVEALAIAWSELSRAHNNQQTAAFVAAEKKLQTAYAELKTASAPIENKVNSLQNDINKAVARFNVE